MQTWRTLLVTLLSVTARAVFSSAADTCTPDSNVLVSGVSSPSALNGLYVKTVSEDFASCNSSVYTNGAYYIVSDGTNWNWGHADMGAYCPEVLSGFVAYGTVGEGLSDIPGTRAPLDTVTR